MRNGVAAYSPSADIWTDYGVVPSNDLIVHATLAQPPRPFADHGAESALSNGGRARPPRASSKGLAQRPLWTWYEP